MTPQVVIALRCCIKNLIHTIFSIQLISKLAEQPQTLALTSRSRADVLGNLSNARSAEPRMSTARGQRKTLQTANCAGRPKVTSLFKTVSLRYWQSIKRSLF